jgi:hypothetical protein
VRELRWSDEDVRGLLHCVLLVVPQVLGLIARYKR